MWGLVWLAAAATALLYWMLFVFGPKPVRVDLRVPSSGLTRTTAWQICTDAAQAQTVHPSTFDADPWSSTWNDSGEGPASLTTSFVAKNSFGLELNLQVRCLFSGTKLTDVKVDEAR